MIDSRYRNALWLLVGLAAACGGGDDKTVDSADGELDEPRRKRPPYEVAPVTAAGTITGTVTLSQVPAAGASTAGAPAGAPQAVAAPDAPNACPPRSDGPTVVYLEDIARGRPLPSDVARRHELAAEPCAFSPRVSIAAAGSTLNLSNAVNAVHHVTFTFEDMKTPMLSVPFSDRGQLVPTEKVLALPGLVTVASDQAPGVQAHIVVVEHPYAVTTTDGTFRLDSVPPGKYSLVVVSGAGRVATTVPVQDGATTTATLTLPPR